MTVLQGFATCLAGFAAIGALLTLCALATAATSEDES